MPILSFDQATPFITFGFSHWIILVVASLAFGLAKYLARANFRYWAILEKVLGYAMLLFFPIHFLVYFFILKTFVIQWDLPMLQVCGITVLAIAGSLLTRQRIFYLVAYFWGFGAMFASFLTPALTEDFPHIYYYLFWGSHVAIMAVLGLLIERRGRQELRYRDIWVVYGVLAIYIAVIYPFNQITGSNYAFVSKIPSGNAFGDLFGPFWSQPPYFLLPAASVIVLLFHLQYWLPRFWKRFQSRKRLEA